MSRDAPFTFYEFFAGGGMARLGLGEAWRCLFANDFDPVKVATYRANFGDEDLHEGDVWKLTSADLPGRADLAWASSPCQDFSLAGARAGLAGGRSSAFFGFWRLIEALNVEGRAPRLVVIENVVGLLTSHGGNDFAALCQALADEGYQFGAVEIDAARFVPQSRPRVFVVAVRESPPDELTQLDPTPPNHSQRVCWAYEQLPENLKKCWIWWHTPYPPARNESLSSVLIDDRNAEWFSKERCDALLALLNERHKAKLEQAKQRRERVVGTIFRRMRIEGGKKVQRAELRFDGYAGCLRVPRGGSSRQFVVIVERRRVKVRGLTSRESIRLMGLDDTYVLPRSTNAALSIAGDGVVAPVVRWLSTHIVEPAIKAMDRASDEQKEGRRARA